MGAGNKRGYSVQPAGFTAQNVKLQQCYRQTRPPSLISCSLYTKTVFPTFFQGKFNLEKPNRFCSKLRHQYKPPRINIQFENRTFFPKHFLKNLEGCHLGDLFRFNVDRSYVRKRKQFSNGFYSMRYLILLFKLMCLIMRCNIHVCSNVWKS